MFFGRRVTPSRPFVFSPSNVPPSMGDVLQLTSVVLDPESKALSVSLHLQEREGDEYLIAILTHDEPQKCLSLRLDLSREPVITVQGKGCCHLVGFYNPDKLSQ